MEWYIMNGTVRSLCCDLGEQVSHDKYILHDECADAIDKLLEIIAGDDDRRCVTKQNLLAEKLIAKDLIPIIKHSSPDVNELQVVLRLFSELCEPIEEDKFVPPLNENVRQDLIKLTRQVRKAFLDCEFVSKLFAHVQEYIQEAGESEMCQEAYDCIKDLLKFVRNILHFSQSEDCIKKHALQGLLLKNDLGSLLIYSITCHARDELVVPVSQVLSLLYSNFQWKFQAENNECRTGNELAEKYVNDRLKRLVVQLLQGPLSTLALSLRRRQLRESSNTDCTYLSWCLTFFLPYINHVPVPISKFRGILSYKYVGYLVYNVSTLVLTLFAHDQTSAVSQNAKDRCMMLFSALDNLMSLVLNCKLSSVSSEDEKVIMKFHKDLVSMSDLWQILLFYIYNFDPSRFPRSFLSQLICMNHKLLTSVEFYSKTFSGQLEQTMLEHIKQFANVKIIQQYTLLVETYSTNSDKTNLAVFTMLYHICIDCGRIDLLYTPTLLRLLGEVTDNIEASEEDRNLASYVINSFLDALSNRPEMCIESFINTVPEPMESCITSDWTDAEESDLLEVYADLNKASVQEVTSRLVQLGINRSQEQVADKMRMMQLDIIMQPLPDLAELVTAICEEGNGDLISWLQTALLTASYTKAMPKDNTNGSPLCSYSFLKGNAYPIIPYTEELQRMLFATEPKAKVLLELLQLKYVECNGTFVPLIPESIKSETLYTASEDLKAMKAVALGTHRSILDDSAETEDEDDIFEQYQAKPGSISSTNDGSSSSKKRCIEPSGTGSLWLTLMQTNN